MKYTVQVVRTVYHYVDVEASSKQEAADIVCDTYLDGGGIDKFYDDEDWEVNVKEPFFPNPLDKFPTIWSKT